MTTADIIPFFVLIAALIIATAARGDVWQDCPTLIAFCEHRTYHRDCVAHTAHGYPRCTCIELRLADGSWPRRSCGWTDDLSAPDLAIEYDPPTPCIQQGYEACQR